MEFNNGEFKSKSQGMTLSSKILLGMIVCIMVIIVLIFILLTNTKTTTTFKIYVDGKVDKITQEMLLANMNDKIYVNIEAFSKLVGYEYHLGEYKASNVVEEDKCYVESKNETATFYSGKNKVYKLPTGERDKEYEVYNVENTIESINGKLYAPIDAISKGFNVLIESKDLDFRIYTLSYLVSLYDTEVKKWGYATIEEQSFENDKALLYGFLIVKKEGGLYKIIDTSNTKEIVLDRYSSINFSEYMQEFYIKSNNKVGVIDLEGKIKIASDYESISVLSKKDDLYLVQQNSKYGVVKSGNTSIIYPEYDKIGIKNNYIVNDKYLLLDTLIPVCKEEKWGAYDKQGRKVLDFEYDGFGYNSNSVEINGVKKSVQPVLEIERANGIVVEKEEKYGLIEPSGEMLVKVIVDSIYAINGVEDVDSKYYMLYKGNQLNIIEQLIEAGKIEKSTIPEDETTNENLVNNEIDGESNNTSSN